MRLRRPRHEADVPREHGGHLTRASRCRRELDDDLLARLVDVSYDRPSRLVAVRPQHAVAGLSFAGVAIVMTSILPKTGRSASNRPCASSVAVAQRAVCVRAALRGTAAATAAASTCWLCPWGPSSPSLARHTKAFTGARAAGEAQLAVIWLCVHRRAPGVVGPGLDAG